MTHRFAMVLGMTLLAGAGVGFAAGEEALARSEDASAAYWLLVGLVFLASLKRLTRIQP